MSRAWLADRLTGLIAGKNRLVTAATAAVLFTGVLAAGGILADAAAGLEDQLRGSEIISRLLGEVRKKQAGIGGLAPDRAASFLGYVNAMAPAVVNLTISPETQIEGFEALYSAAQVCGITLERFHLDEQARRLEVDCCAGQVQEALLFVERLRSEGPFSAVVFPGEFSWSENQAFFTIYCIVMD